PPQDRGRGRVAPHPHRARRRLHPARGMSLRLRLTLVVAVTFALVVIGCVYAAHLSAAHQLRSETDAFLMSRSARFTHAPHDQFTRGGQDPDCDGTSNGGPALADPDAVTQI